LIRLGRAGETRSRPVGSIRAHFVRSRLGSTREAASDSIHAWPQVHAPDELRELILQLIVGAAGGEEAQWRKALGEVEKLPIATHAQSNWAVHPKGSKGEKAVIAQAVDLVREQHRYVAGN
jgi:hypothetical protein